MHKLINWKYLDIKLRRNFTFSDNKKMQTPIIVGSCTLFCYLNCYQLRFIQKIKIQLNKLFAVRQYLLCFGKPTVSSFI